MGFPSTLLLQLIFVHKIKCRVKKKDRGSQFDVEKKFFLPGTQVSSLYFTLYVCVYARMYVFVCDAVS